MTTVVILLMGFGAILIVSGLEATSVTQTISDVWNNKVSVTPSSSSSSTANNTKPTGGTSVRENGLAARADLTRYWVQHRYGLGQGG